MGKAKEWIMEIRKTNGDTIRYTYDAAGNRISKKVLQDGDSTVTWYARDATGNVMSVYKIKDDTARQEEIHLYGSSRLGMTKPWRILNLEVQPGDTSGILSLLGGWRGKVFRRGQKFFELTNHLGNVLVTISDKKLGIDANTDGTVEYYTPDVVSANDYYAFGATKPEKSYQYDIFRYGFNGKEKSGEISKNNYDFGARIYDGRLGRFLSLDPLMAKYPNESNYAFVGNSPLLFADPDGKDKIITTTAIYRMKNGSYLTVTTRKVVEKGVYYKYKAADGRYYYSDYHVDRTYHIDLVTGDKFYAGERMTTGDWRFDSKWDIDTKWGRFMHWFNSSKSYEKEPPRNGGGIRFTSKNGRGGAPEATFPDGESEDIDLLIATLGISQATLSQERRVTVEAMVLWLKDHANVQSSLHDLIEKMEGAAKDPNVQAEELTSDPTSKPVENNSSGSQKPSPVKLYFKSSGEKKNKSAVNEKGPGTLIITTPKESTKPDTIFYHKQ